jgi:hypothetical protein
MFNAQSIDTRYAYAPAFDFSMSQDKFEITPYLHILKYDYPLTKLDESWCLAGYEKEEVKWSSYCFILNEKKPKDLTYSEAINTLLLAFWIFSPTKTHCKYEFGPDSKFSRLMDRFQYNSKDIHKENYDINDLNIVKKYYSKLIGINRRRGRLLHAYHFTFFGSLTINASVAYALYSSAFEAILTYSEKFGITKRLATSYACLLKKKRKERDVLYRQFLKIYDVRSDIMHGRRKKIKKDYYLVRLKNIIDALRSVWKVILIDNNLIKTLEKGDTFRETFFASNEAGYVPPRRTKRKP